MKMLKNKGLAKMLKGSIIGSRKKLPNYVKYLLLGSIIAPYRVSASTQDLKTMSLPSLPAGQQSALMQDSSTSQTNRSRLSQENQFSIDNLEPQKQKLFLDIKEKINQKAKLCSYDFTRIIKSIEKLCNNNVDDFCRLIEVFHIQDKISTELDIRDLVSIIKSIAHLNNAANIIKDLNLRDVVMLNVRTDNDLNEIKKNVGALKFSVSDQQEILKVLCIDNVNDIDTLIKRNVEYLQGRIKTMITGAKNSDTAHAKIIKNLATLKNWESIVNGKNNIICKSQVSYVHTFVKENIEHITSELMLDILRGSSIGMLGAAYHYSLYIEPQVLKHNDIIMNLLEYCWKSFDIQDNKIYQIISELEWAHNIKIPYNGEEINYNLNNFGIKDIQNILSTINDIEDQKIKGNFYKAIVNYLTQSRTITPRFRNVILQQLKDNGVTLFELLGMMETDDEKSVNQNDNAVDDKVSQFTLTIYAPRQYFDGCIALYSIFCKDKDNPKMIQEYQSLMFEKERLKCYSGILEDMKKRREKIKELEGKSMKIDSLCKKIKERSDTTPPQDTQGQINQLKECDKRLCLECSRLYGEQCTTQKGIDTFEVVFGDCSIQYIERFINEKNERINAINEGINAIAWQIKANIGVDINIDNIFDNVSLIKYCLDEVIQQYQQEKNNINQNNQ